MCLFSQIKLCPENVCKITPLRAEVVNLGCLLRYKENETTLEVWLDDGVYVGRNYVQIHLIENKGACKKKNLHSQGTRPLGGNLEFCFKQKNMQKYFVKFLQGYPLKEYKFFLRAPLGITSII